MRNLVTAGALWLAAATASIASGVAAVTLIGPADSSNVLNSEQVDAELREHSPEEQPSATPDDDSSSSADDAGISNMYETTGGTINVTCVDDTVAHDTVAPMPNWDVQGPKDKGHKRTVAFSSMDGYEPSTYSVTYWCEASDLVVDEQEQGPPPGVTP